MSISFIPRNELQIQANSDRTRSLCVLEHFTMNNAHRIVPFVLLCLSGCDAASGAGAAEAHSGIVGTFEEAEDADWAGVVAVMLDADPWPCTGTLIDPEVVLTAAHCVEGYSSFSIRGGADMEIEIAAVTTAIPHPDYDGELADVALLALDRQVAELPFFGIVTVALPSIGTPGKLLGYGVTSTWGEDYGVRRVGSTDVLGYPVEYGDTIVELGGEAGHCYSDSGGPFFVDEGGAWVVDAVSSFGAAEECTYENGSFSTNTAPYAGWIDATVNELTGHGLLDPGGDTDTDAGADADADSDAGDDGGAGDNGNGDGSCDCAHAGARMDRGGSSHLLEMII
jgi:hypothetical protein